MRLILSQRDETKRSVNETFEKNGTDYCNFPWQMKTLSFFEKENFPFIVKIEEVHISINPPHLKNTLRLSYLTVQLKLEPHTNVPCRFLLTDLHTYNMLKYFRGILYGGGRLIATHPLYSKIIYQTFSKITVQLFCQYCWVQRKAPCCQLAAVLSSSHFTGCCIPFCSNSYLKCAG